MSKQGGGSSGRAAAVLALIPGVGSHRCSRVRTQEHLKRQNSVRVVGARPVCEPDVDGRLRGSKVARVKVCAVWPPPITSLAAPRNKMSAV